MQRREYEQWHLQQSVSCSAKLEHVLMFIRFVCEWWSWSHPPSRFPDLGCESVCGAGEGSGCTALSAWLETGPPRTAADSDLLLSPCTKSCAKEYPPNPPLCHLWSQSLLVFKELADSSVVSGPSKRKRRGEKRRGLCLGHCTCYMAV